MTRKKDYEGQAPFSSFEGMLAHITQMQSQHVRTVLTEIKRNPSVTLADILHQKKDLITTIGRDTDLLREALMDISQDTLSLQNKYAIVCALFEHKSNDPWPAKKAMRFIDLLTQITAKATGRPPSSIFSNGNLCFSTISVKMDFNSSLTKAPESLIAMVPFIAPVIIPGQSQSCPQTLQLCEKLAGTYAMDFAFSFVPVLCDVFESHPEIVHLAWRRLSKRPEEHPQWQEAVDLLYPIAKSFEDKKALQGTVSDLVAQKPLAPKIPKL